MVQGQFNEDTLFMVLGFTDGDGDLGQSAEDTAFNLFLIDKRDGFVANRFKTPVIPPQGAGNGVSGEVQLMLFNTCCKFPPSTGLPPCTASTVIPTDSLVYEIYAIDRAGHESNRIDSPPIILRCD